MKALELDFMGWASVSSFDDAPEDRKPHVYLNDAKSVISVGYRLNSAPIMHLPATRSAYMMEHDYANRHLNRASQKITRFFENRGYQAIGFDCSAGFYHKIGRHPEKLQGDFSHKHAAVISGLGKFGVNNLVIHKRWGATLRLTTVITNAELNNDRLLEQNACSTHECLACVKICPVQALDGWEASYDPERGWTIDKRKCYEYIFKNLEGQRCGLCIKACLTEIGK